MMKIARISRFTLSSITAATLFFLSGAINVAQAQFPINEPFGSATTNDPNWVLSGSATLTNEGDGWLQLTTNAFTEAGGAILDTAFPATLGLTIEFEYATYGGTGADGFSVFLFDGSATTTVGATGGALGYTFRGAGPGVTSGYLGIGFDEFGNFSDSSVGTGGPGQTPDTVALRGSGSGLTGFNFLTNAVVAGGIETGSRAGARPVRVTVINQLVTVEIDLGAGFQTIINQFDLSTAPGQAPLPPTLKVGFSASTGGSTNFHEIKNLLIALPVDLSITKTGPATVFAGSLVTYTITATNAGPNTATGATVTDTVPASILGVSWSCMSLGGGATCDTGGGMGNSVMETVTLPPGGTVEITVMGIIDAATPAGSLANTASITPPGDTVDTNSANDVSTAMVMVDLASVSEIPTLGVWGILVLALALASFAMWVMHSRKHV